MWHAVYDSAWQHPGIAWIAGGLALVAFVVRRPSRPAFAALFLLLQAEILVDAWLTSGFSPVGATGPAAERAAVVFVLLGDWRYFYLVLRQRLARRRAVIASLGITLVVPVATGLLHASWPAYSGTRLYFVYEVAACIVVLLASRARTPYARRLFRFELAQYALWASADALILAGRDVGYLLRIVPNALYYAAFVPFAVWSADDEARA